VLKEKNYQNVFGKDKQKERTLLQGTPERKISANETPIDLLDPELRRWIKVIRPSRASLTYERME